MQFNPEDEQLGGPRCRNCHRGSSGCGGCHNTSTSGNIGTGGVLASDAIVAENYNLAAGGMWRSDITHLFAYTFAQMGDPRFTGYPGDNTGSYAAFTAYKMFETSDGQSNEISQGLTGAQHKTGQLKQSRTVEWTDWRTDPTISSADCSDDGVSWPHRTLGWKMLKDDLFGIDLAGNVTDVGETRDVGGMVYTAHDLDSVCLDCHNPTVWNASSSSDHEDDPSTAADDMDDDVLLRGLP